MKKLVLAAAGAFVFVVAALTQSRVLASQLVSCSAYLPQRPRDVLVAVAENRH
jgi:hypothetical protein